MSAYYIPRQLHPYFERALVASLVLHFVGAVIYAQMPRTLPVPQKLEPIQVKFIEAPKEKPLDSQGTLIDAPKPSKIEKPRTTKLLAKHDSRAHSNLKKKKAFQYRSTKLQVPKSRGQRLAPKRTLVPRKRKAAVKPKTKAAKKVAPLPLSNKGLQIGINPQIEKPTPVEEHQPPRSLFALLDGFDANPYARTDTGDSEDLDDGEVISLDTKETLYADYFARIKHQIELVWGYPESAARRGISGQLTLRFHISKDGNLLKVSITRPSGADILDTAAIKAVKMAAPYYPFPVTIKKDKLVIMATFIYSPSYGRSYQTHR